MKVHEALQIVLELARQNVIDHQDMPEENKKQEEAISLVEDLSIPI